MRHNNHKKYFKYLKLIIFSVLLAGCGQSAIFPLTASAKILEEIETSCGFDITYQYKIKIDVSEISTFKKTVLQWIKGHKKSAIIKNNVQMGSEEIVFMSKLVWQKGKIPDVMLESYFPAITTANPKGFKSPPQIGKVYDYLYCENTGNDYFFFVIDQETGDIFAAVYYI